MPLDPQKQREFEFRLRAELEAEAEASRTPSSFVKKTISNIPSSAADVAGGIYQAIRHPVETGKALLDVGAGALQSAFAPESFKESGNALLYSPQAQRSFEAAKDFYKERYGGKENILHTIETDPVGSLMDLSATAGVLGKGAQLAGATRPGVALSNISKLTDPVLQTGKAAKAIGKPLSEWALGMSTGSGKQAIAQALKGGDAFTQAMRGKISETDVLDAARDSLQVLKDERAAAYRSRLAQVASNNKSLDISGIKTAANEWLAKYGIQTGKDGLDFSRSTLRNNAAAANEVKAVYEAVMEWGSRKGDRTPLGLDTLKRVIQDSYTTQNPSRAMVTSLANKVKSVIVAEVPEYSAMTKEYAKASGIINDVQRGLSLSDRAATDTALRKLMTAMREDNTFRRQLIDTLHTRSGIDVGSAVAGLLMKNPWSNRLGPIAHFYGTSAMAAYLNNPALMALLPLASPRLVGEGARYAGQLGRVLPATRPAYQGAFQAGRIPLSDIANTPEAAGAFASGTAPLGLRRPEEYKEYKQ